MLLTPVPSWAMQVKDYIIQAAVVHRENEGHLQPASNPDAMNYSKALERNTNFAGNQSSRCSSLMECSFAFLDAFSSFCQWDKEILSQKVMLDIVLGVQDCFVCDFH